VVLKRKFETHPKEADHDKGVNAEIYLPAITSFYFPTQATFNPLIAKCILFSATPGSATGRCLTDRKVVLKRKFETHPKEADHDKGVNAEIGVATITSFYFLRQATFNPLIAKCILFSATPGWN